MPKLIITQVEWPEADGDEDRAYMRVNDIFDVRLIKTDEGLVVDIFPYGSIGDTIATTYAFDNEALAEYEDHDNPNDPRNWFNNPEFNEDA